MLSEELIEKLGGVYDLQDLQKKVTEYEMDSADETGRLLAFCSTPRTRKEIADFLGYKTIFYVTQNHIQPLLVAGKLKMTIPDKPKSRNQKYVSA